MTDTQLERDNIRQVVEQIWEAMFATGLDCLDGYGHINGGPVLSGCIQIDGAWIGTVVLQCSLELARKLAAVMFGTEQLEDAEICDAVGELTNLVAGGIQSLVPAPSELTPPSVIEGRQYKLVFPRCRMLSTTHFQSFDEPLSVVVFEANSEAVAADSEHIRKDFRC